MSKTIMLSGGFDPIHPGHIAMFESAKDLGYTVVVAVNSDEWLIRKKGFVFQSQYDRMRIVGAMDSVDGAVIALDDDDTVVETLKRIEPCAFGNGGDRGLLNTPEQNYCSSNGIETIYALGGNNKFDSSSTINTRNLVQRPWGCWELLGQGDGYKLKTLHVEAGKYLSMQRHEHRSENWTVVSGSGSVDMGDGRASLISVGCSRSIPKGSWHQLRADKDSHITVVEVQFGSKLEESDIERV